MEMNTASSAFSALAHTGRLGVFRLLMHHMPRALSAGDIAERTNMPASTLSGYLSQLQRSNLIMSERHERHIFYKIDLAGTHDLLTFFAQDCCQGHPEICGVALTGYNPSPAKALKKDLKYHD